MIDLMMNSSLLQFLKIFMTSSPVQLNIMGGMFIEELVRRSFY